jgi:peptidylprolyl isomerase
VKRLLTFSSLALILVGGAAFAQSTTHSTHHTHKHSHKTTTGPTLPKDIPAVHAPVHMAYSLRYQDIKLGTGELAAPGKFYTVHYTGWLASDGTKFDSSVDRGSPITFPVGLHRVIVGWDTGFAGMRVGGKRRLFIPYQLAYGEKGRGPIPPKADLIFDVELISMSDGPPAPTFPAAPAQPPASAPPATPAKPASPQI